ncbi:MAG: lipopolysaccharide heptosyltransferase I [Phycisphaerae bacterium]|jgi:lipopolysaccharide heptosyltransferase I
MTSHGRGGLAAFRRILIIKPSSLGDIVHALPVLAALRTACPRAHIAWLAGTAFVPLLDGHPLLNEVIAFDRRRFGRMLHNLRAARDFLHFLVYIRRLRFDLVIDLQGLFRSGFIAWASGAPHRVGFARARELAPLFYTQHVSCPRDLHHAVEKNLHLASALGLPVAPPTTSADRSAVPFPLGLTDTERRAAAERLAHAAGKPLERFLAIVPGGRWPSKLWLSDYWAQLITRLQTEDAATCVLLGGADDRAYADRILADCTSPPIDLVGQTTLRELVALLDLSAGVVCHDSGPMHLAAALGKPLVALFGPTDPKLIGPYHPQARVVAAGVPCAPCYRRICPLDHHACMQNITVDAVLASVREMLPSAPQPAPASDAQT